MQEQFNLLNFWKILKKYSFVIILISMLGVILSGFFMFSFVESKYISEAQLIVNQKSDSKENLKYTDLQTSINLINTYSDIITSQALLENVSKNIDDKLSAGELNSIVKVRQSPESQSFFVSAVTGSPDLSQKVVNIIIEEFNIKLKEIYKVEISGVHVLSPASYNPVRVSPRLIIYLLIGGLLGLSLSFLYMVIKELSDNTVKDSEYLVNLGLISLGEVGSLTKKERTESRLGNHINTRQSSRRKV